MICDLVVINVNLSIQMVLFTRYGHEELDSREKEFMALTSSNLLRLGLEYSNPSLSLDNSSSPSTTGSSNSNFAPSASNKDVLINSVAASSSANSGSSNSGGGTTTKGIQEPQAKNRYSIYILFDIMTQLCHCLSADLREACFPYSLIRHAYHVVAQQSRSTIAALAHPTQASANAAQIAAGKQIFTHDVASGISSEHNPNMFGSSSGQSHSTSNHRSSVAISN